MQLHQWQWGINQWVEYLRDKALPVMPETRRRLAEMQALPQDQRDQFSARDMSAVVYADPYLALKVLRRAEERRSRQLGHDTTTPLAAVLQTGFDELVHLVETSPDLGEHPPGCRRCEARSVQAAVIARAWAEQRADISPDEVAMAALLADIGELLLWHFAVEMTAKEVQIRDWNERFWALNQRPSEMEFTFRQLTVGLAQSWELPNLVVLLIRGVDTLRANLSRFASEAAQLLNDQPDLTQLAAILREVAPMLPGASPQALLAPLKLTDEAVEQLLELLQPPQPAE